MYVADVVASNSIEMYYYYYLCNESIRPLWRTNTHTRRVASRHTYVHACLCPARARACVCLIFYKFERSETRKNKNDWKCFISMACHYILFEKTKSEALGERSQQQKRRRYTKRTCIERIGAYNVMLCRKFIFNRLCTRTDTAIIIIINI